MCYYFMVDEFVCFGSLYDVIKCYYVVELCVVKDY